MRRVLVALAFLLLLTASSRGTITTTSVTAVVTDQGSQTWNNGRVTFLFVPVGNGPFSNNGTPYVPAPIGPIQLDSGGNLPATLIPSNSATTPSGTKWKAQVCPNASVQCWTSAPFTVSGASQVISSNLVPPAIVISASSAYAAYTDSEVQASNVGQTYFNTTSNKLRVCITVTGTNTCTFSDVSTSVTPGSGTIVDPTQPPYNVKADARYQQGNSADGITGSGTATLTAASLNCTAADVGKLVIVIVPNSGVSLFGAGRTYIGSCSSTTVANVVDGSGNPVNASATAGSLNWAIGTDDTPNNTGGLVAAWAAAEVSGTLSPPCGAMMVSAPPFTQFQTAVPSWQDSSISGCGAGSSATMFIITPTVTSSILTGGDIFFNPPPCSNCTGAPGTGPYPALRNIKATGLGALWNTTSGTFSFMSAAYMLNDQINYWSLTGGGNCSSVAGWSSGEGYYERLNIQNIGQDSVQGGNSCEHAVAFDGQGTSVLKDSIIAFFGVQAVNCRTICDLESNYTTAVGGGGSGVIESATNSAIVNVRGGEYTNNSSLNSPIFWTNGTTGTFKLDHVYAPVFGSTSINVNLGTAGTLYARDSVLTNASQGSGISGGIYYDEGGNSDNGVSASTTLIADGHSVKGTCTGVATSSATLGLFGTGPNVTATTCTSTTIGSGVVVTGIRTLRNLHASDTSGGSSTSSGVFTVLRNGSPTTITCTIGLGINCADITHQVTTADGDIISIEFTTQAGETLAGINAIVEW